MSFSIFEDGLVGKGKGVAIEIKGRSRRARMSRGDSDEYAEPANNLGEVRIGKNHLKSDPKRLSFCLR